MNDLNSKGVVNVYWSAFENSGRINDFLKYKTSQKGVDGEPNEVQRPSPTSHQTGGFQ